MRAYDACTFCAALRKRRKELGYTQAEVAAFSGCSTAFLSALENGKETAEIGRALRVFNVLALDLEAVKIAVGRCETCGSRCRRSAQNRAAPRRKRCLEAYCGGGALVPYLEADPHPVLGRDG